MPASRRLYVNQTVDLTGWEGGEFGLLPIWEAPRHSFTGSNVMRYVGGALGPRYGLIRLTPSGASPTGPIQGMGFNQYATPGSDIWFVTGTTVYVMNSATGVITACTGALAQAPVRQVYGVASGVNNTAKTYIGNDTDKVYVIDHVAKTVAAVAGSPATCAIIAQYGEFTCVSGQGASTNKFIFSAASDPTTWPAANFINIGQGSRITGMWNQRGSLVIATSDGGWWTLKGTPGGSAVLRRIGDNVSPLYMENAAVLGSGMLAFTFGSSTTGSVASLGEFTGSKYTMIPYLFFANGRGITFPHPSHKVVASKEQDDWFVLGADSIYPNNLTMHCRKVWSQHLFSPTGGVNLSSYVAGNTVADQWVLTDGGLGGGTPIWYYWRQYANRPTFTSDTFGQPGDDSTTPFSAQFTTQEITSEVGYQIQPLGIAVDFRSWATGSGASNHFDVAIIVNRNYNNNASASNASPTVTVAIGSYDDPGGSQGGNATSGGVSLRWQNGIGPELLPEGNGFQVQITNIRGVSIERVLIHHTNELTRI